MSSMDWCCTYCYGEGEISYGQTEKHVYVICNHCLHGDAYVWCEKCGEGGQISTTDFNSKPTYWTCRNCGQKYKLPPDFYEKSITFMPTAFSAARSFLHLPPSKKFAKVSPVFLRKFLIGWETNREKFWLAYFLYVAVVFLLALHEPTAQLLMPLKPMFADIAFAIFVGTPWMLFIFEGVHSLVEEINFRKIKKSEPRIVAPYVGLRKQDVGKLPVFWQKFLRWHAFLAEVTLRPHRGRYAAIFFLFYILSGAIFLGLPALYEPVEQLLMQFEPVDTNFLEFIYIFLPLIIIFGTMVMSFVFDFLIRMAEKFVFPKYL